MRRAASAARRASARPTSTCEPGALSRRALIGDIERGVYVTELIGQGVNPVTGDYSRGASGFIIENGEIAAPVAEITIAGNLLDMFRAADARRTTWSIAARSTCRPCGSTG